MATIVFPGLPEEATYRGMRERAHMPSEVNGTE
jgi:hypothetical protein